MATTDRQADAPADSEKLFATLRKPSTSSGALNKAAELVEVIGDLLARQAALEAAKKIANAAM